MRDRTGSYCPHVPLVSKGPSKAGPDLLGISHKFKNLEKSKQFKVRALRSPTMVPKGPAPMVLCFVSFIDLKIRDIALDRLYCFFDVCFIKTSA